METLELPVVEELEETPPVDFIALEIDLAAFRLLGEAGRIDVAEDADEMA